MNELELRSPRHSLSMEWGGETLLETGQKLRVTIAQDSDPGSPREWDNLSTMTCWHRNYVLGDEQPKESQLEWLESLAMELDPTVEGRFYFWEEGNGWARLSNEAAANGSVTHLGGRTLWDSVEEKKQRIVERAILDNVAAVLPLYLYDHGNICLQAHPFSGMFDSGMVGWAIVTKEQARKEYSVKRITAKTRKRIEGIIKAEIEEYNRYLQGDVWGYIIQVFSLCAECGTWVEDDDDYDSCWGFYGVPYIEEEVNRILEGKNVKIDIVW